MSDELDEKASEKLACTAYEAYAAETNWKNFRGDPMPSWNELPDTIQRAWMAATQAVLVDEQATTCAGCGEHKPTPWRDGDGYICVACLAARRDHYKEQFEIHFSPEKHKLVSFNGNEWSFKTPVVRALAESYAQMLEEMGAKNYIEVDVHHERIGGITMTLQKRNGKTPHELKIEAEQAHDELVDNHNKLVDQVEKLKHEVGEWVERWEAAGHQLIDRDNEIERLKEIVRAQGAEVQAKTIRVEMNTTKEGKPCLIVTDPIGDEQKLAETVAGAMTLWLSTADALATRKEIERLTEQKDGAYTERNRLVALLSVIFPSSLEQHEGEDWEDDWRWVVYVDLPTGQASWHIHDSELALFDHLPRLAGRKWDSHTTEEKYQRVLGAIGWLLNPPGQIVPAMMSVSPETLRMQDVVRRQELLIIELTRFVGIIEQHCRLLRRDVLPEGK